MAHIDTPSALMYARLKDWGISNRDAASMLLNTALTFDGKTLRDRVEESSQLSRRIVHTRPGEIPIGLFNSFQIAVPQIAQRIIGRLATTRCSGDEERARQLLESDLTGSCATQMTRVLQDVGIDSTLYRNMLTYLRHADLPQEVDRTVLNLMLFVITGCTGNVRTASTVVVDYAASILGADFHTAQTIVTAAATPPEMDVDLLLGLVRIINGRIEAGSQMHVLHPSETEIGLLPQARHTVTDVGDDVSRRHALAWREDGVWKLRDLGSTNGTYLISGADGTEQKVGSEPVTLATSDIICLGASTRFIVMPVIGL